MIQNKKWIIICIFAVVTTILVVLTIRIYNWYKANQDTGSIVENTGIGEVPFQTTEPKITVDKFGHKQLLVNNQPFIITGAWAAPQIWTEAQGMPAKNYVPEEDYAKFIEASIHCNFTAAGLPIWWTQLEPAMDQYDFSKVDFFIKEAQKHDIKIVLQFIGFNVASGGTFVPSYISSNPSVYSRLEGSNFKGPLALSMLCPNDPDTQEREKKVFEKLIEHIYKNDTNRTIILIRYAGEVGYGQAVDDFNKIFGTNNNNRCHCSICEEKWSKFTLFKDSTERENKFMGVQYANYMEQVASAGKAKYPGLPMYTDVINNVTWPEWAYEQDPSIFKEFCPSFDFIGITDTFTDNLEKLKNEYLGGIANVKDNIPFVSEAPLMETHPNNEAIGFYDVVNYGGIGGMYFDFTGPIEWMPPDGIGGNLFNHSIVRSKKISELLRSYNSSYKAVSQLVAKYKMTDFFSFWYQNNSVNMSITVNNTVFDIQNIYNEKNRGFIINPGNKQIYLSAFNGDKTLWVSWDAKKWKKIKGEKGYIKDNVWIMTGDAKVRLVKGKASVEIEKDDGDYKTAGYKVYDPS